MAAILVNPEFQQLSLLFFGKAVTVPEAAHKSGMKPNTIYVQVRCLVDIGLLVVEREVRSGGRAVKFYRTAAERFFVPFEVMSFESLEGSCFYLTLLARDFKRYR